MLYCTSNQQDPPKIEGFRSSTSLCSIGGRTLGRALCYLGARINLMSYPVFAQLGIGEVKPTIVTLQTCKCSITLPIEKLKMY